MKKLMILTLALLLAGGILLAQNATTNPKVIPGPKVTDNPNLKPRLVDEGSGEGRIRELNLTEAQLKKFDEKRSAFQKRMNTINAEIENLEIDIQQALKDENYSRAKELTKQLYDKKLARAHARIDHMQDMLKELTAEQKLKARDMFMPRLQNRAMMMHRMKQRMGPGPGMHDCQQHKGMQKMHQQRDCDDCADCGEHKNQTTKPKTQHHR